MTEQQPQTRADKQHRHEERFGVETPRIPSPQTPASVEKAMPPLNLPEHVFPRGEPAENFELCGSTYEAFFRCAAHHPLYGALPLHTMTDTSMQWALRWPTGHPDERSFGNVVRCVCMDEEFAYFATLDEGQVIDLIDDLLNLGLWEFRGSSLYRSDRWRTDPSFFENVLDLSGKYRREAEFWPRLDEMALLAEVQHA